LNRFEEIRIYILGNLHFQIRRDAKANTSKNTYAVGVCVRKSVSTTTLSGFYRF
jgi:hypothetical protein